jgi:ubiquinone/menaquinone biosynthesis C-methylase UbiE
VSDVKTGSLGLSEPLRKFVAEFPYERESILAFVMKAAKETPTGARVADVGAGDAPFSELFEHAHYATVDWTQSVHEGAQNVDIVASADDIPVRDGAFDAVLCTQVLEHVAEPAAVLAELHRILAQGGSLYLTAPLVWELHELPYDYYRYTSEGLRHLLESAGFRDVVVEPRNDCFTTLAQLMRNLQYGMGRAPDGLDERRVAAGELLVELADKVAALAPLDAAHIFPLGYSATGVRA